MDFFEFVLTFDDSGERKPHEKPFRAAVDLFGLAPAEILMVGDWPERDMAGARAAGLRTAWASYGKPGTPAPPEADWVLASAEELIRRLPVGTAREA